MYYICIWHCKRTDIATCSLCKFKFHCLTITCKLLKQFINQFKKDDMKK